MKTTLQKEVKSNASVVHKSCTTAVAPKKIETVMRKEREVESRERNVIIHGLAREKI